MTNPGPTVTQEDADLAHWFTRRMDGGDKWTAQVVRLLARHRLATSAPDGDAVERVAVSLWRHEAIRAAPNVAKGRTLQAFREDMNEVDREKWIGLARAAIAAMHGDALKEAVEASALKPAGRPPAKPSHVSRGAGDGSR